MIVKVIKPQKEKKRLYLNSFAKLVGLIETVDQDLAGVATDVSYAHHGQDGPVTPVVHCVRQGYYEHTLNARSLVLKVKIRKSVVFYTR